jgi:hypothetical protein
VHRKFQTQRKKGEWFCYTNGLNNYIEALTEKDRVRENTEARAITTVETDEESNTVKQCRDARHGRALLNKSFLCLVRWLKIVTLLGPKERTVGSRFR